MCCYSFQSVFFERKNKEARKQVASTIIRRSKHEKPQDNTQVVNQTGGEGKPLIEILNDNQNSKHEDENWPQMVIYPEGE